LPIPGERREILSIGDGNWAGLGGAPGKKGRTVLESLDKLGADSPFFLTGEKNPQEKEFWGKNISIFARRGERGGGPPRDVSRQEGLTSLFCGRMPFAEKFVAQFQLVPSAGLNPQKKRCRGRFCGPGLCRGHETGGFRADVADTGIAKGPAVVSTTCSASQPMVPRFPGPGSIFFQRFFLSCDSDPFSSWAGADPKHVENRLKKRVTTIGLRTSKCAGGKSFPHLKGGLGFPEKGEGPAAFNALDTLFSTSPGKTS